MDSEYGAQIRLGEITTALKEIKPGKTPDFDGIQVSYTKLYLYKRVNTSFLHLSEKISSQLLN